MARRLIELGLLFTFLAAITTAPADGQSGVSGGTSVGSGVAPSPTSPDGVPQVYASTPSGGVGTAPAWALPGVVGRAVTGTTATDTIVSTDCAPKRIGYSGSVAVAIQLPTATTLAVPNCVFRVTNNLSTTNDLTVTTTTWTCNSAATCVIHSGQLATFYVDPNSATNWIADITNGPTLGQFGATTCTTVGTSGGLCAAEGTEPTNVAGAATFIPDSATHEWMAATNGASTATPGMMVRSQPSPVNLTGQTALKTTTTLCAASAGACNVSGQYHIHWNFWGSGTACSAVTVGSVQLQLTWTDENAVVHSVIAMPMWDQKAGTLGTNFNFNTALATEGASGDYTISTNGSVIQYATTYTACTTGTGTYNLRAAVTRLQ